MRLIITRKKHIVMINGLNDHSPPGILDEGRNCLTPRYIPINRISNHVAMPDHSMAQSRVSKLLVYW